MHYRRARVPGGCFFFTVVTAGRRPLFNDGDNVALLRWAFQAVQRRHPFQIEAIVVLPDHLHTVWTLPNGDADFPRRWRLIKSAFTRHLAAPDPNPSPWQRRYWEHVIRDHGDYQRHINYIHYNPVKHGLVKRPVDWPWSSFHRYVSRGVLDREWGAGEIVIPPGVGKE
ncbi:MAG: transposase [Alcanivorax sp.]|jgi:putative transposase|nr:transposase [Alcanivorax sp.]